MPVSHVLFFSLLLGACISLYISGIELCMLCEFLNETELRKAKE